MQCLVLTKAVLVAGERNNNSNMGEEIKILGCILVWRGEKPKGCFNSIPRVGRGSLL